MKIISFKKLLNKAVILLIAFGFSAPVFAQDSSGSNAILTQIYQVLQKIDTNVGTLALNFASYVLQWTSPDTNTEPMTSLSNYTQTLGNNISIQNALDQNGKGSALQVQLLNDLFTGVNPKDVPYANSLSYPTLLKVPFSITSQTNPTSTDPAYAYIKNAAGLNIAHFPPWSYKFLNKNVTDQSIYAAYYATVMSIESFNAYILSGFYVDYVMNQSPLTQQQITLINQAKDPKWFTLVASEYIGFVLRQILLYQSQSFVILTELLQTTKQLLAAQAMSNTLLILNNQADEKKLFQKAAGLPVSAS